MRSKTRSFAFTLLAGSLALAFSATASAQEANDRWEISGSYFNPKTEFDVRANGTATDGTTTVSGAERGSISDRINGGNLDVRFRLSPRQRLELGGYRVSGDRGYDRDGAGTYVDGDGVSYDYAYDANARFDNEFDLYRLSYGFDVISRDTFTLTALASVYGAKLDSKVTTSGIATVEGVDYDLSSTSRLSEREHAPGFGLAAEWRPTDKWDVRARAEGFNTSWGSFDTRGHFVHANAQVGYNFTPNWAGFVGYDWFELELDDEFSGVGVYEGVEYATQINSRGRLRVHGPAVGVRYKF